MCPGNCDERFFCLVASRKGTFMSHSGEYAHMPVNECDVAISTVLSFLLCLPCVGNEVVARAEHQPHKTIRHTRCELLVKGGKRCSFCDSHRNTLRVLLGRHDKVPPCLNPDRTNYRYLSTPEKVERLHGMRRRQHTLKKQVARLKSRLEELIMDEGEQVDESLHSDLQQISRESEGHVSTLGPANSFQRLFWMQQQKAASLNNSRSMRWHPLFIKWCLYISQARHTRQFEIVVASHFRPKEL